MGVWVVSLGMCYVLVFLYTFKYGSKMNCGNFVIVFISYHRLREVVINPNSLSAIGKESKR